MNQKKLAAMKAGGRLLGRIRDQLAGKIKVGVTPLEIEAEANRLIQKADGHPSFKMVKGYRYATCININEGVVHGIPTSKPFKTGDLVSLDLGFYYRGFHTDTSTTVFIGTPDPKMKRFLAIGPPALEAGIAAARAGNRVSDISRAIQKTIESAGFTVIRDLTGHGIGRQLHEDPYIPNFYDPRHPDSQLKIGQTLALEPMYTTGKPDLKLLDDGWTIVTADRSLAALFEETIAVTDGESLILTRQFYR